MQDDHEIVVLDKLTYAGRRENLPEGVELVVGAIEDRALVCEVAEGVDAVVNFAAESHVDRSIADQDAFARTHVIGTGVLLDAVRELGVPRYLQVSTDEVYGSIAEGSFTEKSPLDPSSPYSATKAAGDLLVSAHAHTYGIEAVICRGSNNYGPRQYPEKLIPLCVLNAMHGDPLPVYGDGRQVRNWLYVEDFCRAIHTVLEGGRPGEAYNVGGPDECENIDVVRRILELTGRDESLIEHVTRPARPRPPLLALLATSCARSSAGRPQVRFAEGLERTVDWYRDNEDWWGPIRSGEYREYYERHYGRACPAELGCRAARGVAHLADVFGLVRIVTCDRPLCRPRHGGRRPATAPSAAGRRRTRAAQRDGRPSGRPRRPEQRWRPRPPPRYGARSTGTGCQDASAAPNGFPADFFIAGHRSAWCRRRQDTGLPAEQNDGASAPIRPRPGRSQERHSTAQVQRQGLRARRLPGARPERRSRHGPPRPGTTSIQVGDGKQGDARSLRPRERLGTTSRAVALQLAGRTASIHARPRRGAAHERR